jgi:hypothetical protein
LCLDDEPDMTTMLKMALECPDLPLILSMTPCWSTASSEAYREEFAHCELNPDLFMSMPLPLEEIMDEIKKRIGST